LLRSTDGPGSILTSRRRRRPGPAKPELRGDELAGFVPERLGPLKTPTKTLRRLNVRDEAAPLYA